jgi:hypothetical protein
MKKVLVCLLVFALFGILTPATAKADHSWNGYHWAWNQTWPIPLRLGDNLSGVWPTYFETVRVDWNESAVFDLQTVSGQGGRNCRPTAGRVEVCNAKYGFNGWLGIAQIWITGGVHITQGVTKLNDTYFAYAPYTDPAWKQLVVCQEIGHTFGLGHNDEDFNNVNTGTCMDYGNSPEGNEHPDPHDYAQLEQIYGHLDSFSTVDISEISEGGSGKGNGKGKNNSQGLLLDLDNPSGWGRLVSQTGRLAIYERDFGFGNKLLTRVIWATDRK